MIISLDEFAKIRKDIKEFRLGKWGEGDSGVTVVSIK